MNYSELTQAIQDYTQNTETSFVSNIPNFVRQAEERIYASVEMPAVRKNATATLTSGNQYLGKPSDFISPHSLAVSNGTEWTFLINKDVNFIREAYPNASTTGFPKYYAEFTETAFVLGPTPNGNYNCELHYFYQPESIVTASTSWVGDNYESALLYGSLIEAYTYMKGDPDLIKLYQDRYREALFGLKDIGEDKNRKDSYRSGQKKVDSV